MASYTPLSSLTFYQQQLASIRLEAAQRAAISFEKAAAAKSELGMENNTHSASIDSTQNRMAM